MSINLSLDSLIDFIGLIIGLSFGIGIIAYHWKKKAFIYLGLFILVYAFGFSLSITQTTLQEGSLKNILLSIRLSWLLFPLFYIYVQHISSLEVKDVKLPLTLGILGVLTEFIFTQFVSPEV